MNDRYYTRVHAEAILRVAFANSDGVWRDGAPPKTRDPESTARIYIDQRGVWPNFGDDDVLGWKPCWELVDLPQAPDCGTTAGLPFPFTEYQLAAWMQGGVGALVASCFGRWEGGPDASLLSHPEDNKAQEAVKGAFELCRKAMEAVGNEPELKYVKKTTTGGLALRQVTPLSARLHDQWIRNMVQQILCGGDVSTWNVKARANYLSGFYGDDLDAKTWAALHVVDSLYAALLLSGINPARHPDPEHSDLPEDRVIAFRRCLAVLSNIGKDGVERSLSAWIDAADGIGLPVDDRVRSAVFELVTSLPGEPESTAGGKVGERPLSHAEKLAAAKDAMKKHGGNASAAAKELNWSRRTLGRILNPDKAGRKSSTKTVWAGLS